MTPTDIKQALEGGETGRELDAAIWKHFGYRVERLNIPSRPDAFLVYPPTGEQVARPGKQALTTSVDAVLALVEEVLPDHLTGHEIVEGGDGAFVLYVFWSWPKGTSWEPDWQLGQDNFRSHPEAIEAYGPSLPAAILLALINAKEKANA